MNKKWFVLQTEPRAEYHAAEALRKDGFETFLPRLKTLNTVMGRPDTPLFPGYIFVRNDPETTGWPSFRSGHRILGWLNFAGDIPSIPDDFISSLSNRLKEVNCEDGQWRQYKAGDQVRIVSDSIRSMAEVIKDGKQASSRIRVLMDFMGRKIPADVPRENIWPSNYEPSVGIRPPRRTRGRGRQIRSTRILDTR